MSTKPCDSPAAEDGPALMNGWFNRTVAGAGISSGLGDFRYETTTVILPGFLAVLAIPAAALGLIEGIADAVASFTRLVSGYIADKLGHRKLLVLLGYGLIPLGQALTPLTFWLAVDSVAWLAGNVFVAGLYVAVQEALESPVTAEMVRADTISLGVGALGAVNGVAKFLSSATVGVIWTAVSPTFAFALAAGFMLAGSLGMLWVRD